MAENRRPLGETLIEAGVLTPAQLQAALSLQEKRQIRLGTILLQEGIVTEPQLVQALSRQLSIPWVSLWHIDIPEHLLKLVSVTLAEEFFLIPIYVRTSPSGERTLYVAMNDPTDETALRFVSAAAGMAVRPMIAGPSDIAAAIRAYYFGEDASIPPADPLREQLAPSTKQVPPAAAKAAPPPAPKAPPKAKAKPDESLLELPQDEVEEWQSGVHKLSDIEAQIDKARAEVESQEKSERTDAGASSTTSDQASEISSTTQSPPSIPSDNQDDPAKAAHQRQVERHMFGIGHGSGRPKSLSLTLLDGTTISFGGARKTASGANAGISSPSDLLKALRAAAEGTPVDGYLPSDKWEDHIAALIEILLRKHLVSFEEYMAALKKK